MHGFPFSLYDVSKWNQRTLLDFRRLFEPSPPWTAGASPSIASRISAASSSSRSSGGTTSSSDPLMNWSRVPADGEMREDAKILLSEVCQIDPTTPDGGSDPYIKQFYTDPKRPTYQELHLQWSAP